MKFVNLECFECYLEFLNHSTSWNKPYGYTHRKDLGPDKVLHWRIVEVFYNADIIRSWRRASHTDDYGFGPITEVSCDDFTFYWLGSPSDFKLKLDDQLS